MKKIIEALRFGLVSESHIEELTLGFDELGNWATKCFTECAKVNPAGFEVNGPYGTGKSHTLAVIRYLALKKGFLTARIEIDGQNITLANPANLLKNLWVSLVESGLDAEHPLLNLYVKALDNTNGHIPSKIVVKGVDRIKNNIKTIYELKKTSNIDKYASFIDSIISCNDEFTAMDVTRMIFKEKNIDRTNITLTNMIGRKVDNRPYDLIESLAGHAIIARLARYKRLIVTIDEFFSRWN